MSNEKISKLRTLGAEVMVCPTEAPDDDPDNYHTKAHHLGDKEDNIWLDQYSNQFNPEVHYKTTGPEIYDQMEGKLDYIFVCAGTGGTVTGLNKYFKEKMPNVKVIGIDPYGSILAYPDELNTEPKLYKQEGIGQSEMPSILERKLVDEWVKIDDKESFKYARELIKAEGWLSGGSCGAAIQGTFYYLKKYNLTEDSNLRCVIIMPDGIGNYMTKFPRDEWMVGCGFEDPQLIINECNHFYGKRLSDFPWIKEGIQYDIESACTIQQALEHINNGVKAIVITKEGKINSIVDSKSLNKNIF